MKTEEIMILINQLDGLRYEYNGTINEKEQVIIIKKIYVLSKKITDCTRKYSLV